MVLQNVTQGAIDDHTGGAKVLCAKRHQAAIAGINMRNEWRDEDDGISRDLANLEPDMSVYSCAHTK